MSEFSDKCREYIEKSQTNVYQMSKKSGLDRTTLQKMVQGKRLPGKQFLETMCEYLILNQSEKEQLMRLYSIEKMGRNAYECRQEVRQLLEDFRFLRNQYLKTPHYKSIRFERLSEMGKNRTVHDLLIESDIRDALQFIICQVYEEEQPGKIYMDMFGLVSVALEQIVYEESSTGKKSSCRQLVRMERTEASSSVQAGALKNIHMLRTIFPFALSYTGDYEVYYFYAKTSSLELSYALWPHYIVTEKNIVLISGDEKRGVLIEDEKLAYSCICELERQKEGYRKLLACMGNAERGLEYYSTRIRPEKFLMSYETTPCVAELIAPVREYFSESENEMYAKYMGLYDNIVPDTQNDRKTIYGFWGMEEFLCTGHLPEIYGKYVPEVPQELRKLMVDGYLEGMHKKRKSYLLKHQEEHEEMRYALNIELYEPCTVVFLSVAKEFPMGIVVIEEPGVFRAFQDYLDSLIEDEEVFSTAESTAEFRKRCNSILQK